MLPSELGELLHQALTHLYDPVYLERHPLARAIPEARGAARQPRRAGALLREALVQAIEHVRPDKKMGQDSRAWRRYELLKLRYVEAMDPVAVRTRLGISKSRYYDEHRIALDSLLAVFGGTLAGSGERAGPLPAVAGSPTTLAPHVTPHAAAGLRSGLPRPLTSFLGREQEVTELCRLLTNSVSGEGAGPVRLLTLTGSAGTGKTRLALEVAALLAAEGRMVQLIELAPLSGGELVLPAIARALGVRDGGESDLLGNISPRLGDSGLLLVLDNFEHVLGAGPEISTLLAACPHVQALVTSRAPLRIYGEHEFRVPPLATPPAHAPEDSAAYPAVRLFVERAREVSADFSPTASDGVAIAEICRLLDGLPLAIELAAGRTRLLTPREVLARLDRRLTLLSQGARDLPDRQRSLRGAIAWSHDLLHEPGRRLFWRLAVFVGGFTLPAALAVSPSSDGSEASLLDGLGQLVEQSLVRHDVLPDGESRFSMLETIREFAAEQLSASGEEEATRRAHARWCLAYAESAEAALLGPEQQVWLARLEREHDNIQQALAWWTARAAAGSTDDAEEALRLCGALWRFWPKRGYMTESRNGLERLLWLPAALAPTAHRARALATAGVLAAEQGDFPAARRVLEEALTIRRSLGDVGGVAATLNNLGNVAFFQQDFEAARTMLEECLALRRESGSPARVAVVLSNLGLVAHHHKDYVRAREHGEEALALRRETGDEWGIAETLGNLGSLACDEGEPMLALACLNESLSLRRHLDDREGLASLLEVYAGLRALQGADWSALVLAGAAATLREQLRAPLSPAHRTMIESRLQPARDRLGARAQEEALAAGRALSLDEAIALALVAAEAA